MPALLAVDPLVSAALISLLGVIAAGLIGGMFYLWQRGPAGQRNGALAKALTELAQVTAMMNSSHEDYLLKIGEQDRRNREEHERILAILEKLMDLVAPRRIA